MFIEQSPTPMEKKALVIKVRKFVTCLLNNGFQVTSICRAVKTTQSRRIRDRVFGYNISVRILNAYSNHYRHFSETGTCDGRV